MFWTFVDTIASERGRFSNEPQGQALTLTALALPVGTPTSIGFLRAEAWAHFPATYEGLWLHEIDVHGNRDGTYTCEANYRPWPPREVNWSSYRLATNADTVNVKQSLETVAAYGEAGANDPGAGVLGWDGENVNGIDVPAPGLVWIETHHLPQSQVTRQYLGALALSRGHVNSSAWKGFAPGELMFDGLDAQAEVQDADSGEYTWTLTFQFSARPTETDIKIGDITVPEKQGWDRLEIRYRQVAEGGQIKAVPYAVFVERVFPRIDFATFGIGD